MKTKAILSLSGILVLFCLVLTGPAHGQATDGQFVIHMGAAYAKTTEENADSGFFGIDIFAGKMITNNICIGVGVGYDIAHYSGKGDLKERLALIPMTAKALYFVNFGPMLQMYVSAAGGVYRAMPHLAGGKIGDIGYTTNQPGGSVGIGLDYWFLLTTGVGFGFEYHTFKTDGDDLFSYFTARVDYTLIKF